MVRSFVLKREYAEQKLQRLLARLFGVSHHFFCRDSVANFSFFSSSSFISLLPIRSRWSLLFSSLFSYHFIIPSLIRGEGEREREIDQLDATRVWSGGRMERGRFFFFFGCRCLPHLYPRGQPLIGTDPTFLSPTTSSPDLGERKKNTKSLYNKNLYFFDRISHLTSKTFSPFSFRQFLLFFFLPSRDHFPRPQWR